MSICNNLPVIRIAQFHCNWIAVFSFTKDMILGMTNFHMKCFSKCFKRIHLVTKQNQNLCKGPKIKKNIPVTGALMRMNWYPSVCILAKLFWMPNLKFKFLMQSYLCMAIRQKKNVDLLSGFWRSLEKCLRFFALLLTLKNPHTCCLWGNDFFLFIQFTHLWPCCSPSNRTLKDFCKENVSMSELLCNYCLVGMYTIY